MQRFRSETVTLDDIVITEELSKRSPRPPNLLSENQALHTLARQLVNQPETMLQKLVDISLDLCSAGTAGVSLLETTPNGSEVFRWNVLAGALAQYVGGTTPRKESPCGVCLDRGVPVLFSHPERYFTYFQVANTPIVEGLVLPLRADNHALGSIWIMSHDEQRHFDAEDVRVMTSLANFTAATLLLNQRQTQELLAVNAAKTAEILERLQAEERSRALIENLPGGAAFVVDRDLRYLLAEGEALSAAGFKPEDFIGRTIFEVLPPELTANYHVLYRKALAGESFEYEHNAHDRSYISRGTPLRSPNGEVYAVLAVSYDISDRKIAEAALAADFKDTQLLRDLSARLVTEDDIQAIYQEIVATAIALTRADAGSLQILDEATQELVMLANQGVGQKLTEHFYRVNADSNTPCGMALTTGERTFVDFDVPESEDPHGSRRLHREEGYLSAQSTPLIARSGKPIGMVSTHWCKHHRPSDRELRFLDLLVRQAADLIEQRQAQAALRESEARLALELADAKQLQFISSQLLQEENIDVLYEQILAAAIAIMRSEMGSMQMLHPDSNQLQLLAWKGFDPASAAFWEWVQVDSETPCGMALTTGERAIIPDVETWEFLTGSEDLDAFRLSGIRAVQTTPLISRSGRVVGMISTHWRAPHQPSERELGLLDVLARQAADLIEQRQAEAQLRRAAEMDAFRVKLSDALRSLTDPIQIQAQACRLLGEHLGVDRAYYAEVNEAENYTRINQNYLRGDSPSLVCTLPLTDYGWVLPYLQRGETVVMPDIENSDVVPVGDRIAMAAIEVAAHISLPLIKGGALVGALNVTEPAPRQWSEMDIELVRETAERIWAAIKRAYAERDLRQSEEKYRSLFTSIDEGYALCEVMYDENERPVDVRYLEVNPAFEQLSGLENVAGKTAVELNPIVESFWLETVGRVVQTGVATRVEDYAEGLNRWLNLYLSRVGGEGSRQVAVVFSDITDRKRHDANLAFLAQIGEDSSRLASEEAIMQSIGERLATYLRLDGFTFADVDEGRESVTIKYSWNAADVPQLMGTFRLAEYMTEEFARTMRAGETWVVCDTQRDERTDAQATAAIGVSAIINVPYHRRGEWQGCLTVTYREVREWTADEIALIVEVSNRTFPRLERARAEEDLRESEVKYRLLFNSINEGYALCELLYDDDERAIDWRILQVNPAFESLTGLRDVAGKNATQLNQPLNQNWLQTFGMVAQTGESIRFEHYIESVDYWFEILASRIDEDKHHIVVVFNNITDRKQAQADQIRLIQEQAARQQERQRAEALADLDRAKTAFFSNVSHEFRTPITLLLAPLQDALSDRASPLAQRQRERLELAHRNANRLLKLVNTLLDFSRIEAGRMEAVYEPTDLAMLTTELASVFRSAIEQAGLRLIVDCPPLPEPVYVDREMWEKIVLNLLSNAFKFTFLGEIAVRLHLADGDRVSLQVEDTGTGIASEELPHLFERFYQIRGAASRTHEGSGIGLALVQELIKMHGGSVGVSSIVGQGTCFTVTIPFGTAHLPSVSVAGRDSARRITTRTLTSTALGAAPYVEEARQWLAAKGGEPSFSILSSELNSESSTQNSKLFTRNSHVLLVDDNADMRDYLTRILSEYVQVEAVTDGAEALAAVQQTLPDLVLSDVMMPIVDGFELVKALRADARTREVPIILLSARAGEESVVEGLLAGADDYLIKPFSATSLVTRVLAHLGMAQLRSDALRQEKTISRMKDKFLAEVSHELNTPLVAILGWTRLLRSNPSNQSMLSKSLETIERNATLQAKLIEDLLDISRITAGKISLNQEPVELQQALEEAIATISQSLKTKDISLECLLDPLPRIVQADPNRLQQIVLNLLTNAIKFTPNGGRIKVCLEASETQALIILTDNGCGIPGEELPYIFDTFRQGSRSNKGLGLGLAIARYLVELHNGTIYAESSGVGLGATFIVGLPLQQL